MGFVHHVIDFDAGDKFPSAVCAMVDEGMVDAIGDTEGDLGTGGAIEVDEGQTVMGAGEGGELSADGFDVDGRV